MMINWRKPAYLTYALLRGYRFPSMLSQYVREYERGGEGQSVTQTLGDLLEHCRKSVPYYAQLLGASTSRARPDPREDLQRLPLLTKGLIRANFAQLQSTALHRRNWYVNTSGGSTGEPVRLIQDAGYNDRSTALSLFY